MALADPEICEEIDNGPDDSETEQRFVGRRAELRAEKYDGEELAPYFGPARQEARHESHRFRQVHGSACPRARNDRLRSREYRRCIAVQARAVERDTGKPIVFPCVLDDPDEAARQFASVCKSPHCRSTDIESVLD